MDTKHAPLLKVTCLFSFFPFPLIFLKKKTKFRLSTVTKKVHKTGGLRGKKRMEFQRRYLSISVQIRIGGTSEGFLI